MVGLGFRYKVNEGVVESATQGKKVHVLFISKEINFSFVQPNVFKGQH
jgi:hypothetical protein